MPIDPRVHDLPRYMPCPEPGLVGWGWRIGDLLPVWTEDGLWMVWDSVSRKRLQIEITDEERLADLHENADKYGEGWCYFISPKKGGPIKIGYATSVRNRLSNMNTSSPVELEILAVAPGGAFRERAYHFQFGNLRKRGEWFRRSPRLMAEIARLNEMAKAA